MPMIKQGYFIDGNTKLYYERFGIGETIVFLHGFSLDHRMWQDQIDIFASEYQVLTYDMQGFGRSTIPTKQYSHYEDLHKLLSFLKIDKIHLVGLSMGGEAAIEFTLKYPSKVRSLCVIDSSIDGYSENVDWTVHKKEEGIEIAKQNWLNHKVFETTVKNAKVKKKLTKIMELYSGWHWFNNDPREHVYPKSVNRLSEISVPTLIIVGEKDLPYFISQSKILNQEIKASELLIIPGVGHMSNMESPQAVNMALTNFLDNHQ